MSSGDFNVSLRSHSWQPTAEAVEAKSPTKGSHLCERVQHIMTVATALNQGLQEVKAHGPHLVTAGTTILMGLQQLYQGNVVSGGGLALVGGLALRQLMQKKEAYSQLMELLQDTAASAEMIHVLKEANDHSLDFISQNLTIIHQGLSTLNQKSVYIRKLATESGAQLEQAKNQTDQLFHQAQSLLQEAESHFQEGQKLLKGASEDLDGTLQHFDQLTKVVKSKEGSEVERIAQFAVLSTKLYEQCLSSKSNMQKVDTAIGAGLGRIGEAIVKMSEGMAMIGQAWEEVQVKQNEIAKQAKENPETLHALERAQEEVQTLKERNETEENLLRLMGRDLEEAQNRTEGFGYASVIFGGTTAAVLTSVGLPVKSAPLVAATATQIFHSRYQWLNRAHDMIYGAEPVKKEEDFQSIDSHVERVKVAFHKKSTGLWGKWVSGSSSTTAGELLIDLNQLNTNQQIRLPFNLNRSPPIPLKDIVELQKALTAAVNEGRLPPEECLKMLDVLTKKSIGTAKSLVPDEAFFSETRRACEKKIKYASSSNG